MPKEGNMRVAARIFATDKMIATMGKDRTFGQLRNVASLPGIVGKACLMPDGHEGYGFPIGGVAAFDPEQGGVVSPGGVGYDINCLDGETKVLLEHGAYVRIKDIETDCGKSEAKFVDFKNSSLSEAKILYFMKREEKESIYHITTKTGRCIRVTGDHPVYTKEGMKKAATLKIGETTASLGFEGVQYTEPSDEILVDEKAFEAAFLSKRGSNEGHALEQTLVQLNKTGLLPLKFSNQKLPYLAKIAGYVFGDGSISFLKKRKGVIWFYGKENDLESIRADVSKLGFTPSRVYKRTRAHKIKTHYKDYEFVHVECSFKVSSTALASLLVALGTPSGLKTAQEYSIPKWIRRAPLWMKRLFLAAFFGAEMSAPATLNKYNFYAPTLGMNKLETLENNAIEFMTSIKELLGDFGIETSPVMRVKEYAVEGKKGKTCGYRMQVLATPENLTKFFETVSYEYHSEKFKGACLAANYVRLKEKIKEKRLKVRGKAIALYANGARPKDIYDQLSDIYTQESFIRKSLWAKHTDEPRVAFNFMSFAEYKNGCALGEGGLAWDEIETIEKAPFDDFVYDITINDENHNFVADGIVVSNCGVRLIATELPASEVRTKMRPLVDLLFKNVPSGVGSKGKLRVTPRELEEAVTRGIDWAIEAGYGTRQDKERTEEGGRMEGADPSAVTEKAKKRGLPQFGTVGAGNHFIEIQEVQEIMLPEVAEKFGVKKGNAVIMLHCGSRGFGHQVCDDSLRDMLAASRKYNIPLPDPELCCAPINTPEADKYLKGMRCAVNYAFCNRHIMMHWVRQTFDEIFGKGTGDSMPLVYDVCHNIAKFEEHDIDGQRKKVCVHRKGATRAFAAGRIEVPAIYREIGQPVIIPGSMGTSSYLLVGKQGAMENTFGSSCHGAGRAMSRKQAIHTWRGNAVAGELEGRGIIVKSTESDLLAEEAPGAYKDVDEVVLSVKEAGISDIVAQLKPMGVVKG